MLYELMHLLIMNFISFEFFSEYTFCGIYLIKCKK